MSAIVKLLPLCAASLAIAACGESKAPAPTQSAKPATTAAAPVNATAEVKTAAAKTDKAVTYRPVKATLRDNGESVVIMVPDDIDVESGRMLEYRVGEDGKYYLRSVIPQ